MAHLARDSITSVSGDGTGQVIIPQTVTQTGTGSFACIDANGAIYKKVTACNV